MADKKKSKTKKFFDRIFKTAGQVAAEGSEKNSNLKAISDSFSGRSKKRRRD